MRPLDPRVYLLRNATKTLPLTLVIVLAVLLIAAIVSLINSIPLSIRTIYSYSSRYMGVTPRGDPAMTPYLRDRIRSAAPVPLGRIMTCRASDTVVRSIVGKWPFVVVALAQQDMGYYLEEMDVARIRGRRPSLGAPEVLISEPLARNLGKKLGDIFLGPEENESYSPFPVRIVGIADTEKWIAIGSYEYYQKNHFPPIDLLVVFAKDPKDQPKLDAWAKESFSGERARVYAYAQVEKDTDDMFRILYQILNVVIGMLVMVITLMMAMLINIYQSQRLQEFGLLQALGYTKRQMLRRVLTESTLVTVGGWVLGVVMAYGMLHLVKAVLMDPQAFALNPLDARAYLYTLPIPVAILGSAWLTIQRRFRNFDPVGVVERRLV